MTTDKRVRTRSFQCTEGTSSKFWMISVTGASHTVEFGRIGTKGQVKTKTFRSADEAREDVERLIASKLAKGYVELPSVKRQAAASPAQERATRPRRVGAPARSNRPNAEWHKLQRMREVMEEACRESDLAKIRELLSEAEPGSDLIARGLLFIAAFTSPTTAAVDLLLKKGVDPNTDNPFARPDGKEGSSLPDRRLRAAHLAALNSESMLLRLARANADLTAVDEVGSSVASYAAFGLTSEKSLNALLEAGLDITAGANSISAKYMNAHFDPTDIEDADLRTRRKRRRVLDRLLELETDLERTAEGPVGGGYDYCMTPLMFAVRFGLIDIATQLIERGANVNAASKAGCTPLMFAAGEGRAVEVRLLLKHGANADARDKKGKRAIDYATRAAAREVCDLLGQQRSATNAQTVQPAVCPLRSLDELAVLRGTLPPQLRAIYRQLILVQRQAIPEAAGPRGTAPQPASSGPMYEYRIGEIGAAFRELDPAARGSLLLCLLYDQIGLALSAEDASQKKRPPQERRRISALARSCARLANTLLGLDFELTPDQRYEFLALLRYRLPELDPGLLATAVASRFARTQATDRERDALKEALTMNSDWGAQRIAAGGPDGGRKLQDLVKRPRPRAKLAAVD